ncbi:acidic leucine-rich nuclear phosphoprotein 32 family member A [Tanacetum coccineum]
MALILNSNMFNILGVCKSKTERPGSTLKEVPLRVWGDRTQDEWNELVDWWSHPNRVSRSLQNAANRAKNMILTHEGKKSFAQGRNEYKVEKGHYEDLIETWRKGHSRCENRGICRCYERGDQMTQILRQQEQEKELYRKQAEKAQARAYLASLKADAADQRANVAYQNTESIYGAHRSAHQGRREEEEEERSEGEQHSG